MSKLWKHMPVLSAPLQEAIGNCVYGRNNHYDEIGLYKLANEKFLFIRFSGFINDDSFGFTDYQEYDSKEEAVDIYYKIKYALEETFSEGK